jgi:hypothetical protein
MHRDPTVQDSRLTHPQPLIIAPAAVGCNAWLGGSSNWRAAATACVPKGQNLELSGCFCDAVVEIIANPRKVQSTYTE